MSYLITLSFTHPPPISPRRLMTPLELTHAASRVRETVACGQSRCCASRTRWKNRRVGRTFMSQDDIASSEPHQRLCSRMVSDAKQLLNNGASLEGWRRMNAGGEFWSHSGNAAGVLSNSHASTLFKILFKTHSSCWETLIAENRHMSEAMKELSVLKHFSFHTGEVFSNTSQGSVREKWCHREGSVRTQFILYVWKCVGGLDATIPLRYFSYCWWSGHCTHQIMQIWVLGGL